MKACSICVDNHCFVSCECIYIYIFCLYVCVCVGFSLFSYAMWIVSCWSLSDQIQQIFLTIPNEIFHFIWMPSRFLRLKVQLICVYLFCSMNFIVFFFLNIRIHNNYCFYLIYFFSHGIWSVLTVFECHSEGITILNLQGMCK